MPAPERVVGWLGGRGAARNNGPVESSVDWIRCPVLRILDAFLAQLWLEASLELPISWIRMRYDIWARRVLLPFELVIHLLL